MSKLFTFAGVSRRDEVLAFRVANDARRGAHLEKVGHVDVKMVELPKAMTQEEAAQALLVMNFAAGIAEVKAVLEAAAGKTAPAKKAKAAPAKKAKAVKVDKPAKKAKKEVVAADDGEPVMTDAELAAYIEANMKEVTPKMKAEFRTFRAAAYDRG